MSLTRIPSGVCMVNTWGEWETDYTCYAVFYRGETDEVIRRIKYCNGKEAVIREEDKYCYATRKLTAVKRKLVKRVSMVLCPDIF